MTNNIKKEKDNINMNRKLNIFSIMLLMFLSINVFSISAIYQNQLLRYEFEENGGSVIIDSSGFGNNGIQTSCSWSSNEAFGTYALDFDGYNDYVTTLQGSETPLTSTMSFWLDSDIGTTKEMIFEVKGVSEDYLLYIDYNDLGKIKFQYIDENLTTQTLTLISDTMTTGYHNYIFTLNSINDNILMFKDNSLIHNSTIITGVHRDTSSKALKLGDDFDDIYFDLDGRLDEVRIFDFELSQSQRSDLYNLNTITLIQEVEIIEPTTTESNIINSTSPIDGENITRSDNIEVNLNIKASCDLYIDSVIIDSFDNILSFKYDIDSLQEGEHSYFVYCENTDLNNNNISYELSNTINFIVEPFPPSTVNFQIIGVDFDIGENELWITTPCLDRGMSVRYIEETRPYLPKFNENGVYFGKVINGMVSMQVPETTNKYCLYNGNIIVNGIGKTSEYDPVQIYGEITLGSIETPNNNTDMFILRLEQFDIYNIYNPKAWGETWTSLIGGIILFITGVVTLITGNKSENGKISLAGVILILASMGITLGGMFTGVIF